jgi:hypothetical protein
MSAVEADQLGAVGGVLIGNGRDEALAIGYRPGPFAFRVVHHMALHGSLGMTVDERVCHGD